MSPARAVDEATINAAIAENQAEGDCFVAPLLAMTNPFTVIASAAKQSPVAGKASRSFDSDRGGLGRGEAVVPGPAEGQRAAGDRDREEREEGIGRNCRRQFGAEDLVAVIGASEQRADVVRD